MLEPAELNVSDADRVVLDLLAGGSPQAARAARATWLLEREPSEGLAAYLVRQEIFAASAPSTLRMIQKGYVTFEDASPLFGPCGRELLDELCSAAAETCRGSSLPALATAAEPATAPAALGLGAGAPASLPEVGERLGRCLLTARIGRGGTCTVYRALHLALQIPVAVKVLDRQQLNPLDWERSRGEARLLARLNHPNILRILDFDDEGAHPYLVLEHVEGFTLHELIRQSGTLRPSRAVKLMLQLTGALEHALAQGVIHRDLKPANVLLDKAGTPHLADLGIATLVNEVDEEAGIVGTPAYMAPERIRGEEADHRSDIYALGVTLFEMLTGRLPFQATQPLAFLSKHLEEPPPAPHAIVPEIPAGLSQVVLRWLAKSPGDRPQTYAEVRQELEPFRTDTKQTGRHRIATEHSSGFWHTLTSVFRREEGSS